MGGQLEGAPVMLMCGIHYIRELKEAGILIIKWVPGPKNDADMHTKNVPNPLFDTFGTVYFGNDEYFVESDTPER